MKRLLTVPEVANRLSVSAQRVYELVREGLLPAVRLGRQVRVDEKQLEDWLRGGGRGLVKTANFAGTDHGDGTV